MTLIIIISAIFLFIWFLKIYFPKFDNVVLYTGTLGSGKTFCAVKTSLKLLKKNRFKVRLYNLFHSKSKRKEKPLLYSNIPVRISKYEWSVPLKAEHFCMTEAIVPKSIVLSDEIALILSQNDFKTVNDKAISEFCTLFRQYTEGGTWVLTTQNVKKVNHHIRRCLDSAYRLSNFRSYFRIFYKVEVRHIDICEDTINVNEGHSEDTNSRIIGIIGSRKYDTYCYSVRYKTVPFGLNIPFKKYKTKKISRIPIKTVLKNNIDNSEDVEG